MCVLVLFIFALKIEGSGPTRKISLMPLKLFAFEIVDLLTANPSGLPINGVVPTYKEKFGREFVIAKYGVAKLIRALEAITDVIDVSCVWRGKHPAP